MKNQYLFKESSMSFIYYVLILMLSYTGPVYAGLQVEKEYEIVTTRRLIDITKSY